MRVWNRAWINSRQAYGLDALRALSSVPSAVTGTDLTIIMQYDLFYSIVVFRAYHIKFPEARAQVLESLLGVLCTEIWVLEQLINGGHSDEHRDTHAKFNAQIIGFQLNVFFARTREWDHFQPRLVV